MSHPLIGIDLGTTNSLCAVFDQGKPRLIPNAHGQLLTPSVVGVTRDQEIVVGSAARELQLIAPECCVATFKRWMGTSKFISLGKLTFSASELSSLVLKSLRSDAEAALRVPVTQAVITVPAYFNDLQRKATQLAGELAGLRVQRIINEPTAAALVYGFHERSSRQKLMVIDLGGGTFDVTFLEVFDGTLEILSTAGESHLGGEDFTDRLLAHISQRRGVVLETAELRSPRFVARLRHDCEAAKRTLGEASTCRVRIPDEQGVYADPPESVEVTAAEFALAVRPLLERLRGPILQVLRDVDQTSRDLDDVILVGGATRMPLVRQFVRELLQREPLVYWNPDESVALGAAVQAALMGDDEAVDDLVMTDVCPFTLGVETCKQLGKDFRFGYFLPIIHRNTTIPVSREQMVSTLLPNQTHVTLNVYQGESRRVTDNLKLGELHIVGIPRGPAGQEICVRFTYDSNGILEVEAFVVATGQKFATVLTGRAGHLTPDEIAAAVARMQSLKFYPRDEERHRRLLLLAERAVAEIPPLQRENLELAIDFYESAMSSGDRARFASARASLLATLDELGILHDFEVDWENESDS